MIKHKDQGSCSPEKTLKVYAIDFATEAGRSGLLYALPLNRYKFGVTKLEFPDGIVLRYEREPFKFPRICAYGEAFTAAMVYIA